MSSITTSSQGSAFSFTAVGLLDPDGGLDGEELPDDVVGEFPGDGEELPDGVGVHRVGVDVPPQLVQVAAAAGARVQEEVAVRLKTVATGTTDLLRKY